MFLVGVAQFQEHFLADVNLWGGIDDATTRSTIEYKLVTFLVTDVLDGVVDFVLNGCEQALTLLVKLAFPSKVFLFQIAGFFLLSHDGFFSLGFLCIGEEH